jgi:glycosyltransferase involved in cell wall biosynthesis
MSETEDLVSIAMAAYNGAQFLRKQLDSIYNQTYKNIEVVVCDDQSTDATAAILEEYKTKYRLSYFINDKRLGFIKNFEKVMKLCNGRFIALADQDDIWLPDKITRLVNTISTCSLIYSDARYIDDKDVVLAPSIKKFTQTAFLSGKPLKKILFINCVTGCTVLFKRELLDIALPIPEEEHSHDWWLALVACKSGGLIYIDEPLILYRKHSGNKIGFSKAQPLFSKLFGFLTGNPESRKREKEYLELQEKRIKVLREHVLFNEEEKRFLTIAYEYFYDRLHTKVHLKAFIIGVLYGKYFFQNYSGLLRLKATVRVLIR